MRRLILSVAVRALLVLSPGAVDAAAVFDADGYLASAYRSDLYGGEVWTITYSAAGSVHEGGVPPVLMREGGFL